MVAPSARERFTRDTAVRTVNRNCAALALDLYANLGGIERLDQLRKCYVLAIFASTF